MKAQEGFEKERVECAEYAEAPLICKSSPVRMATVLLPYGVIFAVVAGFQILFFLLRVFSPIQVAIAAAFFLCTIWYMYRAVQNVKHNFLNLYDSYYETKDGRFSYRSIRDMDVGKNQLTLKMGTTVTIYASNAEELANVIRARRNVKSVR